MAGARLKGVTTIIGEDTVQARMEVTRRLAADHVVDFKATDPVGAILKRTDGHGVGVAIDALGTQATFEAAYDLFARQRDGVLKVAIRP
jgi:alcohol dehydrogenase